MSKVELLIHPDDIEAAAALLLTFKELKLVKPEAYRPAEHFLSRDWPVLDNRLTELVNRLQQLLAVCPAAQGEQLPAAEETRPRHDIIGLENVLAGTEERLRSWQQELTGLALEREQFECIQEEIDWLNKNRLPWEEMFRLELLHLTLGWIPAGQADKMSIPYLHTPLLMLFLPGKNKRVFVLAVSIKSSHFILAQTLATLFFEPLALIKTGCMSNPGAYRQQGPAHYIQAQLSAIKQKQQHIENQRRHFIDIWCTRILSAWQLAQNDLKTVRLIEQYALPVGDHYYLNGFVPEKKYEQFTLGLKKVVKNPYAIFYTKAGKRRNRHGFDSSPHAEG
jgi:hypothetical protein